MKKEIAMKWIKALRSGKYKQGKERLRYDNSYCCLGVLCDISEQGEWDIRFLTDFYYLEHSVGLPSAVCRWSEIQSNEGTHHNSSLADLNDMGWSFKRIATYIEKHWKEL